MIYTREQWGARYGDGHPGAIVPATEIFLHHSATAAPAVTATAEQDAAAVRQLEQIGASRFGPAYGLSYTFVVAPSGRVFAGHDPAKLGAHTAGRNTRARAICLIGDYTTRPPTGQQLDAIGWLLREGVARGWWVAARLTGGHRDVKATACPGDLAYAAIGEMNARAAVATPAGPSSPGQVAALPNLAYGQNSPDVAHLQAFLRRVFPSYAGALPPTGLFGPLTREVVREFQARSSITGPGSDGTAVGPLTNSALAKHGYRARTT